MEELQGIFANACSAVIVEDTETDRTIENFTHWQRICVAALAAVGAAGNAWLQLISAGVVLNSNDLGMSASEKKLMRQSYIRHLLGDDQSCKGLVRMSTTSFRLLCEKLEGTGRLKLYGHRSADEQVATFLFIVGQKFSNRAISFMMSRSGGTCSRYFHNVIHALLALAAQVVRQPTENHMSNAISQSTRFYPFFKDCLGAVDGTHVRVKVPILDAPRYCGRKDYPTQNVLACCTFDMHFCYILAGWEGSASDSRVLKSALTRADPLKIPNGKYYLGDAGFGLSNKILVPYGKTRYHLKEYAVRGPQNHQELFNLRHASLRNCIERCFGVLKKRFPILSTGSECQYSCETMRDIILACCVLHNFLIDNETEYVTTEEEGIATGVQSEGPSVEFASICQADSIEYSKGHALREQIAIDMWNQYNLATSVDMEG